ncbi:MAG: four helix bundle protein [Bacteroidota bacterium]
MKNHGLETLEVYQAARRFRKKMYRLARTLPPIERYNLASQIMRASTSLTNNIAEGHGRFHYQESMRFFRIARGSLEELIDDLNICLDESYIEPSEHGSLHEEATTVERLINGYLRFLRRAKDSLTEGEA